MLTVEECFNVRPILWLQLMIGMVNDWFVNALLCGWCLCMIGVYE